MDGTLQRLCMGPIQIRTQALKDGMILYLWVPLMGFLTRVPGMLHRIQTLRPIPVKIQRVFKDGVQDQPPTGLGKSSK